MANITFSSIALLTTQTEGHGAGYIEKEYELTFDANADYPNGGVVLDLTKATNANYLPRSGWARNPDRYDVTQHPGTYLATVVPGTGLTNWAVKLFGDGGNSSGGPLVESVGSLSLSGVKMRVKLSGKAI